MTWSLALNLAKRSSAIHSCYTVTIYSLGDAAHAASHSDHNPDSRGIVHAIDVMMPAGSSNAITTLRWLLADPTDLQYVIHDRKIYEVANGFAPRAYTGTDPHTNHIHVSGRHGSVGANSATGTGYSLAAEAYTPKGTPCKPYVAPTPPPEDEVSAKEVWDYPIQNNVLNKEGVKIGPTPANVFITSLNSAVDELRKQVAELEARVDGLYPSA